MDKKKASTSHKYKQAQSSLLNQANASHSTATSLDGFSHVDQALVTGESVPVPKKVNDCVFAGTLNTGGVLKIEVTKKSTETLVSRIVQLVIESQKRKASIERLVDRFAKIYVPIVIVLAVFTAVAMPYIAGGGFETWFYRSLMLLGGVLS